MNERLRSLGLRPHVYGAHPGREGVKAHAELGLRRSRHWIARHLQGRAPEPYEDPLTL